jgi:hypothetical protein
MFLGESMARLPEQVVERLKTEVSVQRLAEVRGVKAHDQCYHSIGVSTYQSWEALSATAESQVKARNQSLCEAARQSNAPGSGSPSQVWLVH